MSDPLAGEVSGLPFGETVAEGLRDAARGIESVASLLVAVGAPRLRGLGIAVPAGPVSPELRLYRLLSAEEPHAAHSRYNALIRRLVSFERALEAEQGRALRASRR